jgi:transcriptional regulator with XRE-family HTH domain
MAILGTKMRQVRKSQGLTLAELADMTGLTSSLLSQVERGLADPSLSSLRKIAHALDVPLAYFFIEDQKSEEIMHESDRSILVSKKRGVSYEFLSSNKSDLLEFTLLHIDPGGHSGSDHDMHHGEEVLYVLQGRLTLKINEKEYSLEAGDSIHFESDSPHSWTNTSDKEVIAFSVVTPSKWWESNASDRVKQLQQLVSARDRDLK